MALDSVGGHPLIDTSPLGHDKKPFEKQHMGQREREGGHRGMQELGGYDKART